MYVAHFEPTSLNENSYLQMTLWDRLQLYSYFRFYSHYFEWMIFIRWCVRNSQISIIIENLHLYQCSAHTKILRRGVFWPKVKILKKITFYTRFLSDRKRVGIKLQSPVSRRRTLEVHRPMIKTDLHHHSPYQTKGIVGISIAQCVYNVKHVIQWNYNEFTSAVH